MTSKKWREFSDKSPDHNRMRIDFEAARRHLTHALNASHGVDFSPSDDYHEFIVDTLDRCRALLGEFEERLRRDASS